MKQIYFASNILFSLISLIVLLSPLVPPSSGWVFGFMAFLVPVFIIINIFHLLFLIWQKSYLAILPGVLLLWGAQFLPETYGFHTSLPSQGADRQFTVLTYNTSYFRKTPFWKKFKDIYEDPQKNQSAIKAKAWLQAQKADIYCFQEFYDDPKSDFYNIANSLATDSTYSVFLSGGYHKKRAIFTGGIAIISRFPIVNKGEIFTDKSNWSNRSIFADLLLDTDTIRMVNLHLHSMMLNPLPAGKNLSSFINYAKNTYYRVKSGLLIREKQAKTTIEFIKNSPYPVIVAGDFNEIPYGYVYRKFSNQLDNAFEKAGKGFGFSLNTRLPFLRIDNQFYDSNTFKAVHYKTFRDITISEHYPVQTVYRFTNTRNH